MTTARTFLGIPVEGDINEGSKRPAQKSIEELQPLLQALLDDETIACFGWHQFTPFFNDGDPCVFSADGVWAARPEDLDPDIDEDDEQDTDDLDVSYRDHLGSYVGGEWVSDPENPGRNKRVGMVYEGPDQARYDRCMALYRAVESGEFDNVLLDAFGDHARITIRRDGIQVDSYEHD